MTDDQERQRREYSAALSELRRATNSLIGAVNAVAEDPKSLPKDLHEANQAVYGVWAEVRQVQRLPKG